MIKSAKVEGKRRFYLPIGAYMVRLGKDSRVVIVRYLPSPFLFSHLKIPAYERFKGIQKEGGGF